MTSLQEILRGLQTGGIFFYTALWSILFGVAVTAAIDVFVDKEKMARLLGGRATKTVGVAAATGAASSACTYGAVTISQALFKKGASVGVVVGMLSFIGSIGIVPFAAALAIGGVGFPGVVGCIVADLITIPVLNVWRRYFGIKATAYILAVFYIAMVGSTVLITYLFQLSGWLPSTIRAGQLSAFHFRFNYTLMLTMLFLTLTAVFWAVKRQGEAVRTSRIKTSSGRSAP